MSSKIAALVEQAKAELVAEAKEELVSEIKVRIREIHSARKVLDMLETSYENRLREMETDLEEVLQIAHE